MRWRNTNLIVEKLEAQHNEEHPDEKIDSITLQDLHDRIIHLDGFDGNVDKYDEQILRNILNAWKEKAQD